MHFQVPQFTEVEPRIIGPLTLKQFFFLLGPTALMFLFWFVLEFFLWLVASVFLATLGLALAFLKINEAPFYKVVVAFLGYTLKPHLYLWKQVRTKPAPEPAEVTKEGRLRNLAGRLNIFHN